MTIVPARLQGFIARRDTVDVEPLAISAPMAVLLAVLSGSAGVIHLVMVPSHMGESAIEGIGFAIAGWLQLGLAMFVLARPSRGLLFAAIVVNGALIGGWIMSRTTGLPFGAHAWHPEGVSLIDATCIGIETAAIAVALALLARPSMGRGWQDADRIVAYSASVGAVVLATMALASPSARDHAAGSHGMHAHEDDRGLSLLTNGHHHDIVQHELDAETQTALDAQLAVTRDVARRHPTVADAEAAGYRRAGPYSPGIGAHYIKYGPPELNGDGTIDGDDANYPLAIIYDGTDPGARIAGFMFYSMSSQEPQGFAGPNDVWHYHENICLKYGPGGQIEAPFGPDNAATEAQCTSVGGRILTATQWMLHVWSVPGYDNVDGGVFAEVNPGLDCPDGTYYQLPPEQWASNPLSTCRL